ncbi:DUF4307 domain-containing protein [Agromyces protaetiae]|uniref:DUF4307 domain-containing protein n=1 Tax=Agromyces protaetiae TaxID=2509455 RepID=A0A4V0YH50_9MICO|nr:DUF4307 domain-containing protein [Agromyces protaetiae]QAY73481.1 DUF4307 domain-containing protein [Agromyces protaetiae]
MSADDAIASRYGRTRRTRRRDRIVLVAGGVFAAIVVIAWVIWAGSDSAGPSISTSDTGHTLHNDARSVEVRWNLTVQPGTETVCVVKAYNDDFTVVGWKVVELPASDRYTRSFTETVRVAQPANTGLIDRCWLA